MIRIAIVEDIVQEAELLEEYIKKYGDDQRKLFQITKFKDAFNLIDNYKPNYDIIFMDIEMPNMNGMDAAHKLRELDDVVTLIFVTNMAKYAVKGYEVDALDFIVKPVKYPVFKMKFKKALNRIVTNEDVSIIVSKRDTVFRLTSKQIVYIEVTGHKLTYHLTDGEADGHGSMTDLEKQLNVCNFLRCHSSFLINPQYVSHVQGNSIIMTDGSELRISRPRKKEFMQQLAQILGGGGVYNYRNN